MTDNGARISPDIAPRIFEPFFTTKKTGCGTGYGLALARSLVVERHGGSITFTSESGAGTTFTVRLPVRSRVPSVIKFGPAQGWSDAHGAFRR